MDTTNMTKLAVLKSMDNEDIVYDWSIHAEIDAIMKIPRGTNMRKVKLFVVRDRLRMSKPCEKCEAVIRALGIHKVYYSCDGQMLRMD